VHHARWERLERLAGGRDEGRYKKTKGGRARAKEQKSSIIGLPDSFCLVPSARPAIFSCSPPLPPGAALVSYGGGGGNGRRCGGGWMGVRCFYRSVCRLFQSSAERDGDRESSE